MKTPIKILFFTLCILITSCSIEKRHYMDGYHVQWRTEQEKNKKENPQDIELLNEKNSAASLTSLATTELSENVDDDEEIYASSSNTISNKSNSNLPFLSGNRQSNNWQRAIPLKKNNNSIKVNQPDKIVANSAVDYDDDDGNVALRTIGWIFIGCGFLVFWFASIVIGILIMLLGLVFAIAGRKKSKSNQVKKGEKEEEKTKVYVDVVYLKNGGIIRGMIIEQIPNVQLKIQTKDESVFVYKMDEIEKITKELSK